MCFFFFELKDITIHFFVSGDHCRNRKIFFHTLAAGFAVYCINLFDRFNSFVHIRHQKTRFLIRHNLPAGTAVVGNHRHARRHRLGHHQSETVRAVHSNAKLRMPV